MSTVVSEALHWLKLHPQAVYPTSAGVSAPGIRVSAAPGGKKRRKKNNATSGGGGLITATLL